MRVAEVLYVEIALSMEMGSIDLTIEPLPTTKSTMQTSQIQKENQNQIIPILTSQFQNQINLLTGKLIIRIQISECSESKPIFNHLSHGPQKWINLVT